ncbi:CAP domain-containing protein [Cunninghamella echinulata]|nr:CAP domain-containing protein [Cunninghamella echinulata]
MNKLFILLIGIFALVQFTFAASKKDIKTILNLHNKYRKRHGSPALKWDASIARFAQSHTNKCKFEHSRKQGLGENIAMGQNSWNAVVKGWYDEEKHYDYNNPGYNEKIGHFSAVVWKSTSKIGCGVTKCRNGAKLYSCNYKKPGNYEGQFKKNVLRPKK